MRECQRRVEEWGVEVVEVEGDGNCLFRAVAEQLHGREHQHELYRHLPVEYIRENESHFSPFLDEDETFPEYVESMTESGTWGGHFELLALSRRLRVHFLICYLDRPPFLMAEEPEPNLVIHLFHHLPHYDHYSSLRLSRDLDSA